MAIKSWRIATVGVLSVIVGIVCLKSLEGQAGMICMAVSCLAAYLCYIIIVRYNRIWRDREEFAVSWIQRDAYSMMVRWSSVRREHLESDEGLEKMPEAVAVWRKCGYRQVVTMLTRLHHYERIDGLIRLESGPIFFTFLYGYMMAAHKYERLQAKADQIERQRKANAKIRSESAATAEENASLKARVNQLEAKLQANESAGMLSSNSGAIVEYIREVTALKRQLAEARQNEQALEQQLEEARQQSQDSDEDVVTKMMADQDTGMSLAKIGEKYGLTKDQVRYQIKKRREQDSTGAEEPAEPGA